MSKQEDDRPFNFKGLDNSLPPNVVPYQPTSPCYKPSPPCYYQPSNNTFHDISPPEPMEYFPYLPPNPYAPPNPFPPHNPFPPDDPYAPSYPKYEPFLGSSTPIPDRKLDCGFGCSALAYAGLQCYNLQNRTNFQTDIQQDENYREGRATRFIMLNVSEDREPTRRLCTMGKYTYENNGCMTLITTVSNLKQEGESFPTKSDEFNKDGVDNLFKGDMPSSMPHDTTLASIHNGMQFYEVNDEAAPDILFPYWCHEVSKTFVQTRQDLEAEKMKVNAENAIFYISYKTHRGVDVNAIIRRTMDGIPQHMSLEVKLLM
ncbi:unnamed protein product [Cochlearia groenlandica]